jgi:hypothetical protein
MRRFLFPPLRYLAFYGEASGNNPNFNELELELQTPINDLYYIKHGYNDDIGILFSNVIPYVIENPNPFDAVFNGNFSYSPKLQFPVTNSTRNRIYWYMDLGNNINADVISGSYWTINATLYEINIGKLYGSTENPINFDASVISNWTYICDLTKNYG